MCSSNIRGLLHQYTAAMLYHSHATLNNGNLNIPIHAPSVYFMRAILPSEKFLQQSVISAHSAIESNWFVALKHVYVDAVYNNCTVCYFSMKATACQVVKNWKFHLSEWWQLQSVIFLDDLASESETVLHNQNVIFVTCYIPTGADIFSAIWSLWSWMPCSAV